MEASCLQWISTSEGQIKSLDKLIHEVHMRSALETMLYQDNFYTYACTYTKHNMTLP